MLGIEPYTKTGTERIAAMAAALEHIVFDEGRLRFVVGKVEDTLRYEANLPDQIALLRLDTDWYESTKVELERLWPRLVPGGILIVDDYGHWAGSKKAVDGFFGKTGPKLRRIDYSAVQAVKPC